MYYLVDSQVSIQNSNSFCSFSKVGIKRQYTNATSMKAGIYENILKMGQNLTD
jgi:hypothetical protein